MGTSTSPPGQRALPAPPPPPPSPPPLVRRTGDRLIAGVAAGIGRRWGIDPVIVRVLFVVGVFTAFLGPIVYAALWLAMPQVDEQLPTTSGEPRPPTFWLGAVLLAIGGLMVLSRLPAPGILAPIALIAVGVALWQRPSQAVASPPGDGDGGRQPSDRPDRAPAVAAATPSGAPATTAATPTPGGGPGRRRSTGAAATSEAAIREPDVHWWVPPEPRPAPSWLGPVTIAAALVVTGIVAGLGSAEVLAVSGADLLATALLVLAAGLVVGAWFGRAKWITLPAFVLVAALVGLEVAASVGVDIDPSVGSRLVRVSGIDDTDLPARLGAGELRVDLSDAPVGTDTAYELDLGAGTMLLEVPWAADVVVTGHVGVGNVEFWDRGAEVVDEPGVGDVDVHLHRLGTGADLRLDEVFDSPTTGDDIVLDLAVGAGQVEIRRAPPPEPFDAPATTDPEGS